MAEMMPNLLGIKERILSIRIFLKHYPIKIFILSSLKVVLAEP